MLRCLCEPPGPELPAPDGLLDCSRSCDWVFMAQADMGNSEFGLGVGAVESDDEIVGARVVHGSMGWMDWALHWPTCGPDPMRRRYRKSYQRMSGRPLE